MEATEQAALLLSVDERLQLIATLWDSLVDEVGDQLEVSPEIAAELDRRLEEHRREPKDTVTLAEFKEKMRGRR
jgi:putative addiction module component (TIGR02574 family)